VKGDASETALLRFCDAMLPIDDVRSKYRIIFEIPFSSANKWHLVICEPVGVFDMQHLYAEPTAGGPSDHPMVHVAFKKGAPERVFDSCEFYLYKGKEVC